MTAIWNPLKQRAVIAALRSKEVLMEEQAAEDHMRDSTSFYRNTCIQTCYDKDDAEIDDVIERNWIKWHEFLTVLKSMQRTNSRQAQILAGNQPILQLILSFLVSPKNERKDRGFVPKAYVVGESYAIMCAMPDCPYSICTGHDWGEAFSEGGGYYSYDRRKCSESKCDKYFCWDHYGSLSYSDVCTNAAQEVEISLGAVNYAPTFVLCPLHKPVRCTNTIDDDEDDLGFSSKFDVQPVGEICGLYCCSRCIHNHECGESPIEYC